MIPETVARYLPKKLYQRMALVQGGLLLCVLAIYQGVIIEIDRMVEDAADESLLSPYAAHLADFVSDALQHDRPYSAILDSLRDQFGLVGKRVFVLDHEGFVLTELTSDTPVRVIDGRGPKIDLVPVEHVLSHGPDRYFPALSTDPGNPSRRTPFVVSRLRLPDGTSGYLYLPLGPRRHGMLSGMTGEVVNTSIIVGAVLSSTVAATLAALWLFQMTTRRFSETSAAVTRYAAGDFSRRAPDSGGDELGALARTVNEMADAILARDHERQVLLSGISHDLHAPVSVLAAYTDTLIDSPELLTASDTAEWALVYRRNLERLQSLLEELFEVSLLGVHAEDAEEGSFDLDDLLVDLSGGFREVGKRSGISVVYNTASSPLEVCGSATQFARVISNIVGNAIRHTEAGGTVTVSALRNENFVTVRIADTGEGIPPDQLSLVMERFSQGSHTPRRVRGLAGLGLAICREILRRYGSDLEVESTLGVGTVFSFRVRLATGERGQAHRSGTQPARAS